MSQRRGPRLSKMEQCGQSHVANTRWGLAKDPDRPVSSVGYFLPQPSAIPVGFQESDNRVLISFPVPEEWITAELLA